MSLQNSEFYSVLVWKIAAVFMWKKKSALDFKRHFFYDTCSLTKKIPLRFEIVKKKNYKFQEEYDLYFSKGNINAGIEIKFFVDSASRWLLVLSDRASTWSQASIAMHSVFLLIFRILSKSKQFSSININMYNFLEYWTRCNARLKWKKFHMKRVALSARMLSFGHCLYCIFFFFHLSLCFVVCFFVLISFSHERINARPTNPIEVKTTLSVS